MIRPNQVYTRLVSASFIFVFFHTYTMAAHLPPTPLASEPLSNSDTSSLTLSSYKITDSSQLFLSKFDNEDWSGDLLSYSINSNNTLENEQWSASNRLDTLSASSRTILSYDGINGVAFDWDSLGSILDNSDAETPILSEEQLNYLRGDRSNEGSDFRVRSHLLGDIINSTPVYVGAPRMFYPDADPFGVEGDRYSSFQKDNNDRTPIVYIGANDGMLHGFDAGSGDEKLAYVPETLFPQLHSLTEADYEHRYYVDQTATISDAYFGSRSESASWKTVLIGGLGAGGKGLYALDISNPDRFSEDNASETVLWEFNANDDADLGFTLAQPVIGLTESGRWAAFVGNGYAPQSGEATLFIIYLDANPSDDGGWEEGINKDYIKISTGLNSSHSANGLFSPVAVDSDGNGKIDRIYAGDLKGNLWAFEDNAGWDVAYKSNNGSPRPLFKTMNNANGSQPITVKPTVIRHPGQPTTRESRPNLMLYFGTGQFLTNDDLSNSNIQSFYAVWDRGTANLSRDDLEAQSIISGTDTSLNINARLTDKTLEVAYASSGNNRRYGWYVDLVDEGERVVAEAVVKDEIIFFATYTPSIDGSDSSWFMTLSADNGGPPLKPVINLYDHSTMVLNEQDMVNIEGTQTSAPSGLQTEGTLSKITQSATGMNISTSDDNTVIFETPDNNTTSLGKRLSWKEIRPD